MNQSELRIGNNISFKGKWNGTVLELRSGSITISNNHGIFSYESFEGIPLTEEILLRCGFKKQSFNMSGCHVYQIGIIRVLKSFVNDCINEDYSICIHGVSPPTWSIADFKYLHQLENIYFSLTNKELMYQI